MHPASGDDAREMFGVNVEYVVGFGANLVSQRSPRGSASLVVHQVGYVVPKDQFEGDLAQVLRSAGTASARVAGEEDALR